MKIFLIEVYNEKTNWKIQKVKRLLGIKFADMFRAGVSLYLDKLENDGAVSFSDAEFAEYMKEIRDSGKLG
ncbi:MAG: hypothetical protein PUF10_02840 [Bacteroidales bacterium]|nr:hypothetical protein [Bacteroidales bacterium]